MVENILHNKNIICKCHCECKEPIKHCIPEENMLRMLGYVLVSVTTIETLVNT